VVIEADTSRRPSATSLLVDDLSFTLPPAGIVGVIGANGAGKSTLFKMLIDEYEAPTMVAAPDSGSIRLGATVQLGYVDQNRTLDPREDRLRRDHRGRRSPRDRRARDARPPYVASFNFKGPDQQKNGRQPLRR
jgi:sulfate-transporting ATPase